MSDLQSLNAWVDEGRERGAQDLLTGPYGSSYRIDGTEYPIPDRVASVETIRAFCSSTLPKFIPAIAWDERLAKQSAIDYVFESDSAGRCRVHVARTRGLPFIALRYLESTIPTYEELGLPSVLSTWTTRRHGAILLGGLTDSGKTTAIARLVRDLAQKHGRRVVTIDDPIEYEQKLPTVIQKEVGVDVPDAEAAVHDAKREKPDVIVFGVIRSIGMARGFVAASESGHITIGTTHISDMSCCCEVLEAYFPADERHLFRTMFARQFIGGVGMALVPRLSRSGEDKFGRVLASEVLVNNMAIASNLRNGAPATDIRQLMLQTDTNGMRTLEQHLSELQAPGVGPIDAATAQDAAVYIDDLKLVEAA